MSLDFEITERYWLSRDAFLNNDMRTAMTHYRALRAEHSVELYYEVELQAPVRFVHPLGSVLGRATYAPNLVVYQNVGVGSDLNGNRPKFTGPCVLFPGAKVLGNSVIGANVYITANTVVSGGSIPDNSIVCLNGIIKPTTRSVIADYFGATP